MFPAKAWFRHTQWDGLINTVLQLERTVCKRDPKTGLWSHTSEIVFWISSLWDATPERWNEWIRGHWKVESTHYVRDATLAEDASRIRKNPGVVARLRSFAYNLLRNNDCENMKADRYRAALDINKIFKMDGLC